MNQFSSTVGKLKKKKFTTSLCACLTQNSLLKYLSTIYRKPWMRDLQPKRKLRTTLELTNCNVLNLTKKLILPRHKVFFNFKMLQNFTKGPDHLGHRLGILPHDIESCNFQNLLIFRIPETSQSLISFWQLLFSSFQKGDPLEKSENPRNLP